MISEAAVRDFGRALRRAFEALRQYKPTHAVAREARERAIGALLMLVKTHGELELELTAMSVQHEGAPIEVAKNRTDSIALPLFREGVRRLTFTSEVAAEELHIFFTGWFDAWLKPLTSDGVTTRLWERQPPGIRAVILDSFGQGGEDSADDQQQTAAATTVREQVDAILGAFSSASLAGASEERASGSVRISLEDAALLGSAALRSLTADQLANHDVAVSNLTGLDAAAQAELADELSLARPLAASRFVTALVNAALLAGDDDRTRAVELFERFTLAMVGQGACEVPYRLYREQSFAVPRDRTQGPVRVSLLKRFRSTLMSAPVIEALLAALDDTEAHQEALLAFNHLGKACVPLISQRLARLTTPEGRARALKLLNTIEPGSAAMLMSNQARTGDGASLADALDRVNQLPDSERVVLVQRALNSPDVGLRRRAMQCMTPRLAALVPAHALNNRLGDSDPEVRAGALALAVELESPAFLPALMAGLKRPIETEERARVYQALATIGGPGVVETLVSELQGRTDTDLRVAAAKALGMLHDPRAKEALAQVAAKLLTPPRLRQACRAALGVAG